MTESILGKSGLNKGKLASEQPPAQPPKCPECTSRLIWKDGFRYVKTETAELPIQRYLCRNCGRRFSEPQIEVNVTSQRLEKSNPASNLTNIGLGQPNFTVQEPLNDPSLSVCEDVCSHGCSRKATVEKGINSFSSIVVNAKVCAKEDEAKNLVGVESQLQRAKRGATTLSTAETKGKIVEYSWYLTKQGYATGGDGDEGTVQKRTRMLQRLVNLGANLYDPENVKEIIALQETWSQGTKTNVMYTYESFLKMEGLTWDRPRYKHTQTMPFVPWETEITQLINACGLKVSVFLETLKESGCDPGEAKRIEWIDINEKARTLSIRFPVKGHRARILSISHALIERLQLLPKTSEKVFPMTTSGMRSNYALQRKRKAKKLNNPRLLKLTFRSIRHWKATVEYHRTKDILHVQRLLGHKTLSSTMIYIDIERALYGEHRDDEFTSKVATCIKEDKELIEAGFEYITERQGLKIYRKRK